MVDGDDNLRNRPLRPSTPPGSGPVSTAPAAPSTPAGGAVPRPRPPVPPTADPAATTSPTTAATSAAGSTAPAPADTGSATARAADTTSGTAKAADTGTTDAADGTTGTAGPTGDDSQPAGRAARRRYRVPFARAVRLPPARQAATRAVRATRAWSKRPTGRFALSGMFLLTLVCATAATGALLVPAAAPRPLAGTHTESTEPTVGPSTGDAVPSDLPWPGGDPTPVPTGRPADALAEWARVTGEKVGIPQVAMQAYGYAELVLARTTPGCELSWTTLAAIGYVESRHGSANGAQLLPDGRALPEIIGDPLDGNGGRQRILDTDQGRLDRDTVYDRAVGPMQFIPTTWQEIGADADNDGVKDPHDLDDAALAAGNYLCKGGRKLTVPGDWWNAILSYNNVQRYAQDVFAKANEYGLASRR